MPAQLVLIQLKDMAISTLEELTTTNRINIKYACTTLETNLNESVFNESKFIQERAATAERDNEKIKQAKIQSLSSIHLLLKIIQIPQFRRDMMGRPNLTRYLLNGLKYNIESEISMDTHNALKELVISMLGNSNVKENSSVEEICQQLENKLQSLSPSQFTCCFPWLRPAVGNGTEIVEEQVLFKK